MVRDSLKRERSADYNRGVKILRLHSWQLDRTQARELQLKLATQVVKTSQILKPRFIAGMDISASKTDGTARAAAVILKYPELEVVEVKTVTGKLEFPYIPGLLSFREAPLTLAVSEKLSLAPDLILVDGQGILHPRRFGLASHLGLFLDTPTIGCAKSLLCGEHREPSIEPGSHSHVVDKGEVIGAALRTKAGTTPIYISIGHKIDLDSAMRWAMQCCRGFRVPEPTRLAHLAAGGNLKEQLVKSELALQGKLFG